MFLILLTPLYGLGVVLKHPQGTQTLTKPALPYCLLCSILDPLKTIFISLWNHRWWNAASKANAAFPGLADVRNTWNLVRNFHLMTFLQTWELYITCSTSSSTAQLSGPDLVWKKVPQRQIRDVEFEKQPKFFWVRKYFTHSEFAARACALLYLIEFTKQGRSHFTEILQKDRRQAGLANLFHPVSS